MSDEQNRDARASMPDEEDMAWLNRRARELGVTGDKLDFFTARDYIKDHGTESDWERVEWIEEAFIESGDDAISEAYERHLKSAGRWY